jgi:3-hydroxyisobutyrate dehydrogenase
MNPAFLGLGAIGRPMAARVAMAFPNLVVWNRSADKAQSFAAEHSVRAADSPADAAADADVVITCFPLSRDVESLLDGPSGLLATMRSGSTLVDCTSAIPQPRSAWLPGSPRRASTLSTRP